MVQIISRAEIVEEDDSLTHDCDKCGHYRECRVTAPVVSLRLHLPVSPIRCFPNNSRTLW
jgi:hypothetical protein